MSASQAFSQKLYEAAARDSGAEGSSAFGPGRVKRSHGSVNDDDIVDAEDRRRRVVDDQAS